MRIFFKKIIPIYLGVLMMIKWGDLYEGMENVKLVTVALMENTWANAFTFGA